MSLGRRILGVNNRIRLDDLLPFALIQIILARPELWGTKGQLRMGVQAENLILLGITYLSDRLVGPLNVVPFPLILHIDKDMVHSQVN